MSDRDILETAKRRWKLVNDAESAQRLRETEDLKYQIAENQWPAEARKERSGTDGYPARPMLSVSLLHQPMQIVQNQAANANLAVKVSPAGETNKELARVKEELYRRIQRDSNAALARLWALDRAKQAGRGWYRVVRRYDEDSENPLDQEIGIERILDQSTIYADPSSQMADYSDGRWLFCAAWLPLDVFRERYPKAKSFRDGDFRALVEHEPDWVRGDGPDRAVFVAEYYDKRHKILEYEDRTREVCVGVTCRTICGVEVLEGGDWGGKYIPFVPVLGKELQPIEGERRWEGMVRPARDAQQFFNYSITSAVERMALEPRAPYVGYAEQFQGFEKFWDQANRRNFPYLPVRMLSADGKPLPLPQRSVIDTAGTSLAMMGTELGRNLVQSATAIFDPGLGQESDREKSGRAILALQQQGDAGTSHYLHSLATVSMPYEARIVLDLMPKVYDRPGRVTTLLGGEDEVRSIMLGVPFVTDPETQLPREVPKGTQGAQFFDLSEGRYSTAVTIGKSYQTRLQEGREALGEMLPELPPEAQVILLPTFLRYQDSPGAQEAADLMKKFRDMKFPGLSEDGKQPLTAEQAQSKVAALEQQMQMMQQQLQAAVMAIETEQAKQQAVMAKAQLEAQTKLQLAALEQQGTAKEGALEVALEKMEEMQQQQQRQFEALQATLDRRLELTIHREEMAHEVAMADAGGRTATYSRNQGQESGQEQENENSQGQTQGQESSSEAESGGMEAE